MAGREGFIGQFFHRQVGRHKVYKVVGAGAGNGIFDYEIADEEPRGNGNEHCQAAFAGLSEQQEYCPEGQQEDASVAEKGDDLPEYVSRRVAEKFLYLVEHRYVEGLYVIYECHFACDPFVSYGYFGKKMRSCQSAQLAALKSVPCAKSSLLTVEV